MTQAQTDPAAAPPVGAANGTAAPPASPDEQAAQQPSWMERIPREYGGDYSAAFHNAKVYRTGGWEALAEKLGPQAAHRLMALSEQEPDRFGALLNDGFSEPPARQEDQPADPTAYDSNSYSPQFTPQVQPGMRLLWDPETQQYVQVPKEPDPFIRKLQEQVEQLTQTVQSTREQTEAERRAAEMRQRIQESETAEQQAIIKSLKALGIEPKPSKMDWMGRVQEVDPNAQWATGGLKNLAEQLYQQSLEHVPQDDVRHRLAPPPEMYEQAAEAMRPFLAVAGDDAVDKEVSRQQQMPQDGPPDGPGGRPQAAPEEMSDSERYATYLAELKAEGKALDIPDE